MNKDKTLILSNVVLASLLVGALIGLGFLIIKNKDLSVANNILNDTLITLNTDMRSLRLKISRGTE